MSKELPKAYDPKQVEGEIYRRWEASGFFNPDNLPVGQAGLPPRHREPYTIVLPPPNVTGTLHLGHAVMLTIEDILIRFWRMRGRKTLWLPGTDHAAIATQALVEKRLYDEAQKTRYDLGRETFLAQVEAFAAESHDTIVAQIRRMGASVDWSREAYTLDEARSRAVRTAFERMYGDGLIYRGSRIVNWDPKLQTTVSDDEVDWREEHAPFYFLRYGPFIIGTARPETKFGDKYVVVHPDDARYAKFRHGEKVELEWINGAVRATIIKDAAIDPSFGTGAMTITPWHDRADFEIAERHKLEREQIIGFDGKLLPIAGEFAGMPIATARPAIVEKLNAKGLLERVDEGYVHRVATNSRGGGRIEPQVKEQWFVDVNREFTLARSYISGIPDGSRVTLKRLMRTVVENGEISLLPERFVKVYYHWIDSLRDWCISRQLWYGHRIPAWFCVRCGGVRMQPKVSGNWYFVRHGETDWNREGRLTGHSDIGLNASGREQARAAAEQLRPRNIELVISSDLVRARETAAVIAGELGAELVTDAGFRERNFGELEGRHRDDLDSELFNRMRLDPEFTPAAGESLAALEERISEALARHRDSPRHQNVVVVSHGTALRMLLGRLRGLGIADRSAPGLHNAAIVHLGVAEPCASCGSDFVEQDSDTLDTWFSSGLWTFSTLGWPEETRDLTTYHPTDVLETGYDILFFWVARMILMTTYHLGMVPFRTVYLHGLVRDKDRQKMSKSKGNVIDPLGVIDLYGTDALRMALVVGNTAGNDIVISEDKIRGYRNFANKLWNIHRFITTKGSEATKATPRHGSGRAKAATGTEAAYAAGDEERLAELYGLANTVTAHLERFEFHHAAEKLYHYVWHVFADTIIEEAKPRLASQDPNDRADAARLLLEIHHTVLKLLHPFMPFITEALWRNLQDTKVTKVTKGTKGLLMVEPWPVSSQLVS